uniref:(R)-specific enoyl-CoA hydratase n=1 Tax=Anthurium amnicola TaxID=1678845 RepID=A0A1D1XNM7_9ARAE
MFLRALPRPRPGRVASLSSCSSSSTAAAATQVLKVGDVLRLSRRFSEADVLAYSKVSGDANPVHFDADFARGFAGFRDPVVHGMLVASLFPTIIASHLPGAIYISQTLQFKLPVYVGDEILAEVQPVNVRENKKRYIAKFLTKCFMVGGEPLVLDGEATAILPTLALNS